MNAMHAPWPTDPANALTARIGSASLSPPQVEEALRFLPSHGWTSGWDGRQQRAWLVVSQIAKVPADQIAWLNAGDVIVAGARANIHTTDGDFPVIDADDTLMCGPCALARWLHTLDMTVIYPIRVLAAVIARAAPLSSDSPHVCHHPAPVTLPTQDLPLFPALRTASTGPRPWR